MTFDVQQIAALAIVASAAAFVLWTMFGGLLRSKYSQCGSCNSCSAAKPNPGFVALEQLKLK